MTREELDKLTPEEKKARIAQAIGWKNVRCDKGGNIFLGEPDDDFNRDVEEHKKHGLCGFPRKPHRERVPNYLNDLNSCHDFEKTLKREQESPYIRNLMRLTNSPSCSHWDCAHATATQRCEAFLLTI